MNAPLPKYKIEAARNGGFWVVSSFGAVLAGRATREEAERKVAELLAEDAARKPCIPVVAGAPAVVGGLRLRWALNAARDASRDEDVGSGDGRHPDADWVRSFNAELSAGREGGE